MIWFNTFHKSNKLKYIGLMIRIWNMAYQYCFIHELIWKTLIICPLSCSLWSIFVVKCCSVIIQMTLAFSLSSASISIIPSCRLHIILIKYKHWFINLKLLKVQNIQYRKFKQICNTVQSLSKNLNELNLKDWLNRMRILLALNTKVWFKKFDGVCYLYIGLTSCNYSEIYLEIGAQAIRDQ